MRTGTTGRDRCVAWATCGLAGGYLSWMGIHLWRAGSTFAAMYTGLGAELPLPTLLLVRHGGWFYPLLFGMALAGLVVKEAVLGDKRFSTMLTCGVVIAMQFIGHWLDTLYYLPLLEIVRKLS